MGAVLFDMAKAPAFQLYAGDFLTDVMDWTDEQVGVHIRLLCWSWVNRRGIPWDTQRLTRIAPGAVAAWPVIGSKWVAGPDETWVNERLESTRSNSDAFRASQRERSLLAVAARLEKKHPNGTPTDIPNGKPMGSPTGDPLEGEEEVSTQRRKERAGAKPKLFPIVWPKWAGENTLKAWEAFKIYRQVEHKARYKSADTEQKAVNILAGYFKSGPMCVSALEHATGKNWRFPVDPAEYSYPKAEGVPVEQAVWNPRA